jgi:hypothetical protein
MTSPEEPPFKVVPKSANISRASRLDEGIASQASLADYRLRWLLGLLAWLRSKQRGLYGFLSVVMFIGIATPAVVEVDRSWFIFALIALFVLIGLFISKFSTGWDYRLTYGRPMFGSYGGVPRQVLKAEIECAADVQIDLPDQDMKDLAAAAHATEDFIAAHTKNAYFRFQKERNGQLPTQEQWEDYWVCQTTYRIADSSYRDALTKHPQAFALVPIWLLRTVLVVPLAVIGFAVVMLLSPIAAESPSLVPAMLVTSVFFALLASVVTLWLSGSHRGVPIPLDRPDGFDAEVDKLAYLSEQERSKLKAQAASLAGRTALITGIRIGTRYKAAITMFLGRQLVVTLIGLLIVAVVEIGVCLLAAAPFAEHFAPLASQYGRQAGLLALSAVVMLVAYYFWAFLFSRIGDIVAPVIGAVGTAVIIPVGQYIFTGHLNLNARTITGIVAAAVAGAFGGILTELAKRPDKALPQKD